MRRALLFLVLAACGRDTGTPHDRDWPAVNGNDAPLPDPALADDASQSGVSPLATSFKGSIADLRQAPNVRNGIRIKLPSVVVVSVNGGGDYMHVSDAEVGEFSGLEVQRCISSDTTCKTARPVLGSEYSLSGTLGVSFGALTLTNVKAEPLGDSVIDISPIAVTSDEVEVGKITGNENIHSSYVGIIDDQGGWAELEVSDIEPASEKNTSFPADLDMLCGVTNLQKPEVVAELIEKKLNCCPSGVGPKYGNVHLKDKRTGKKIALGTGNYKDIEFTGWPCSDRDLDKALRVGDKFLQLEGVFSIKRTANAVSPTRASDYYLVKKPR